MVTAKQKTLYSKMQDIILISTKDVIKKHVRQYIYRLIFLESALVMGIWAGCR